MPIILMMQTWSLTCYFFIQIWSKLTIITSYLISVISDHTSLTIDISIMEEFIQEKWHTIIKNSKEEENFISELTNVIGNINLSSISDREFLKLIISEYVRISESTWYKFSQYVNITKHSKTWWNKEYQVKMTNYKSSKMIEDWKIFKGVVKKTKHLFFNDKIQEITLKNCRP